MTASRLMLLFLACCLLSCGSPVNTPCEITGSGFHAKQNCQHKCLQYTQIECPSGEVTAPQVCSGAGRCQPGTCPSGQACYHLDDAFEEQSYCVPISVCGEVNDADRIQWEQKSKLDAAETRRKHEQKFGGRGKEPTPVAEPVEQ